MPLGKMRPGIGDRVPGGLIVATDLRVPNCPLLWAARFAQRIRHGRQRSLTVTIRAVAIGNAAWRIPARRLARGAGRFVLSMMCAAHHHVVAARSTCRLGRIVRHCQTGEQKGGTSRNGAEPNKRPKSTPPRLMALQHAIHLLRRKTKMRIIYVANAVYPKQGL